MAYRDLDELLDGRLELPIGGTVYAVPPVDAETGLRLQRLHDWMFGVAAAVKAHEDDPDAGELSVPEPGGELLSDAQEIDMYRKSLGTAYDEMVADGVAWPRFKVAGMTAFLHHTQSPEAAEAYWNTGGRPEASAGNRASRRAAARSTPQRASGSGTTRTRKAAPATAHAGRTSSRAGRSSS
ncbi:hypothetical protein ACFQ05_11785 [Amycolatopsis umgeniensis]|uniref:DUF7426 domain-containing protein n=1 Tax=Amycolatopsis umgeniensis TaxID=336628 RepID=A0A841B542_9PSEU|nr:hypothetical protein [Amycolatopsis umgeniensis]MBB5853980.1 hypothetical protein [Amycolatopsis umgeniensis]